jgi:hypothetical protein
MTDPLRILSGGDKRISTLRTSKGVIGAAFATLEKDFGFAPTFGFETRIS